PARPAVVFTPEYRNAGDRVDEAFLDRDGTRIAANIRGKLWLGDVSGRGWGVVGEYTALGWADQDRIAVLPSELYADGDPFAIEVGGGRGQRGEISLWRHPERVRGNRSPGGAKIVYEFSDYSKPPSVPREGGAFESRKPSLTWPTETWIYDGTTATKTMVAHRVDLTGGLERTAIPARPSPTSVWSPTGDLCLSVTYSPAETHSMVRILAGEGTTTSSFRAVSPVWRAGWLDRERLWLAGPNGVSVRTLRGDAETAVTLPGMKRDAVISHDWTMSVFTPANDIPVEDPDLVRAVGPAGKLRDVQTHYSDPKLGVAFTLPPSWSVREIRDGDPIGPYPGVRLATNRFASDCCDGVFFTTTSDDVETVEEKLDRWAGFGEPDGPASVGGSPETVGGRAFTYRRYDRSFESTLYVFLIGRVGEVTFIFRAPSSDLSGLTRAPDAYLVTASIQFEAT
ncbi:MAG TPA: hypothetical protein VM841_09075, partial [Actinomycetota bacterium]|nr:hypothetical protein [Actinomycetota bacterium]